MENAISTGSNGGVFVGGSTVEATVTAEEFET